MVDNDTIIVGVGQRDSNSWTEQYLRQMYAELPFDMNLISANDKKIPVHLFVLMMFSPHLRKKLKTEMVFERGMDVPFKEYTYEILCELVKMLYFGEVAIRVQMLSQFNKILHHLEIACPCCMPIECLNRPGEESDGDGWEETNDDANVAVMHGNGKMYHGCTTPHCPAEIATKAVDGKIMIKNTNSHHSSECVKMQDEKCGKIKVIESVNRKRPKSKRNLAKKKDDSDSEGYSKSSDDDVPKKQMKKVDVKSSTESAENIEPKSTDTKAPDSDGSTDKDKDKEQVGKDDRLSFKSSDESDRSDSSLDSTDSLSDCDSIDSSSDSSSDCDSTSSMEK